MVKLEMSDVKRLEKSKNRVQKVQDPKQGCRSKPSTLFRQSAPDEEEELEIRADIDLWLVMVNSSFGVSLVLVMPVSFTIPMSGDNVGKTKTNRKYYALFTK